MFDWLIAGAGFAGSVLAERLANETDARVLIIDRRNHIGGNAYDRYDEEGGLVPYYGRHVLNTADGRVLKYLSRFARWEPYKAAPDAGTPRLLIDPGKGERLLVPSKGYNSMFEAMLESPNIKIMLNVDYAEVRDEIPFRRLIYTGSLDEYFDYCYGKLPYWPADKDGVTPHWAPARAFLPSDVIQGRPEDEAGYPVAAESSRDLYQRYLDLAEAAVDVFFTGRLAAYQYRTIDEVVAQSLTLFDQITGDEPVDARSAISPSPPGPRRSLAEPLAEPQSRTERHTERL
jgi:UDP-galactopyranose mutase